MLLFSRRSEGKEIPEMAFRKKIQLNLIQEVKTVLDFLALVNDYPSLYAGPLLKNAIRRYEVFWLPLAAKQGSDSTLLAAPLDIAWVWHLHMLAPYDYQQDCVNLLSQVVDHKPMNRNQREQGLQNARHLWENAYPSEPFEVDLKDPTPLLIPYPSRISYDFEKASYVQSKFYYQVSLPHFADSKFLTSAIERYDHHIQLKSQHRHVSVVPCVDVELVWYAHLQHPLNYKRVTTEMFGVMLNPENHEARHSLEATEHNSEKGARSLWSAAGFHLDKPGTAVRGDPPHNGPPRPEGFYASLGRLQYTMNILQVEVVNADVSKTFYVRIYDPAGNVILEEGVKGGTRIDLTSQCVLDNEKRHTITVTMHQKIQFGERVIGSSQTSLLSYLDACPYGESTTGLPWVIDIPFSAARSVVRLATQLNPPVIEGYRFKVQPDKYFVKADHPSLVLSFPKLMFSPSDFAKTYLPCESATHILRDCRGQEAFRCRVVHSTAAALSAVEIISPQGIVVASAHTISPNILPQKESIEDHKKCVYINQTEGERATLIRSRKDWGICVGKWQRGKMFNRSGGHVEITFFKINGETGWCEIRNFKGGMYLISVDSGVFVYVDLKRGLFVMSPSAHDIPELLALAFSVSILYLLCKPFIPTPANESSPSFHKKAHGDHVTPMLLAAGYKSTTVPTNVYLLRNNLGSAGAGSLLDGAGIYDLDSESGPDWIRELQSKKQEALLWYHMSGVPYELATKKDGLSS